MTLQYFSKGSKRLFQVTSDISFLRPTLGRLCATKVQNIAWYLHLRGDPDTAVISPPDVEGDDPDVVTSYEERVVALIVYEKREHAPQVVEKVFSFLEVQGEDCLAIGTRQSLNRRGRRGGGIIVGCPRIGYFGRWGVLIVGLVHWPCCWCFEPKRKQIDGSFGTRSKGRGWGVKPT